MIEIEAVLDEGGVLKACKASGHAKAGKTGDDPVCAGVSVLLGTALVTLSNRRGVSIKGDLPEKGQLWLETEYEAEGRDFLFACGEFLLNGLKAIAIEFPKNCMLNIRRI